MSGTRFIGLLRGFNVGGHNKIPMTDLRTLCTGLGWNDVQTYIQSGNLVFSAKKSAAALERVLELAIEQRFGIEVAVIIRRASDWSVYVDNNPFPEFGRKEPKLLMLGLAKSTLKPHTIKGLRERAANGEQLAQSRGALWIHFAEGVAKSKLSPALVTGLAGSPVTFRNWRTVLKLQEMTRLP